MVSDGFPQKKLPLDVFVGISVNRVLALRYRKKAGLMALISLSV